MYIYLCMDVTCTIIYMCVLVIASSCVMCVCTSEQTLVNPPKNPAMFEKIVEGKLNKRLAELSLLGQVCIEDVII